MEELDFTSLHRTPTSPAEVVRDFMRTHKLTQDTLAKHLGMSRRTVNQILGGLRNITPNFAVRMAIVSNTSPRFWMNLQLNRDIYLAQCELEEDDATKPVPIVSNVE